MRGKALLVAVAFMAVIALFAGSAGAGTLIEFYGGSGGSITTFGDGSLAGSGIPIMSMYADGAQWHNGWSPVVSGVLSFTTGGEAGASSISVTGSVLGVTGQLLSGTISEWLGSGSGIAASGHDTKSPALLQALGISTNTTWEFFAFSVSWAGSGSPSYAYVQNTAVPETSSLVLLGTALAGLGGLVRRYWGEFLGK
jgi:hypothetical protein